MWAAIIASATRPDTAAILRRTTIIATRASDSILIVTDYMSIYRFRL